MTTSQLQQLEIETLTTSITALAEGVNSAMLAGDFVAVQRKTKMIMVLKKRLLSMGALN